MKRTLFLAALISGFLLAPALHAEHWTAVASTGTVDEAAETFYAFGNSPTSLGYLGGSAVLNPIVARYNVTNTSGQEMPLWNQLELGYFDNSAAGQVVAQFFRVDPCTGVRTLICSVTSVNAATASCVRCSFATGIDFSQFLYYVEVTISRSNAAALPAAHTLRIF